LSWEIIRPKQVHLTGVDLDGNGIDVEADDLVARCFQHELDHVDGILLLERLDPDTRKQALKVIRERSIGADQLGAAGGAGGGGGGLPGLGRSTPGRGLSLP